ncbi:unnamed protein product [Amaranthus hypochondriacus]
MASSSATSTNPILPKFSGKNYEHWNVQMKVIFKYNDVWEIVEKGHIEPTEQEEATMTDAQKKELNETRKKDFKALSFIHSAMDGQNMFEKIAAAETIDKAWDILNKVYQGNTRVKNANLQHLKSDFESLKMKRSETASEYVDNVTSIVNNMKALRHDIKECDVVSKILRSMTSKYETIVCMLDERSIKEDLSLDEVLGTLMVHEKRQNSYEPEEQALQAKTPIYKQGNFRGRGFSRGRGSRGRGGDRSNTNEGDRYHREYNGNQRQGNVRSRGRGGGGGQVSKNNGFLDKSRVQCFNCTKYGHYSSECHFKSPLEERVNHVEKSENESNETILMVCNVEEGQDNIWYLDTGSSNHMCGNKELFSKIDGSFNSFARLVITQKLTLLEKEMLQFRKLMVM